MSGKQAKRARKAEVERLQPVVSSFLRDALDKLRHEYARRSRVIRQADPEGVENLGEVLNSCDTCAFKRSADYTDGYSGFLQTSCMLVHALDTGAPFYCHEPKTEGDEEYRPREISPGRYWPCIGWLTVNSPKAGEPLNVRELLGDTTVDIMVEGSRILNPERQRPEALS